MRILVTLLCAGVLAVPAALAQELQTPGPVVPPSFTSSVCEPPVIDVPASDDRNGCFYAEAGLLLQWFKPVCASVPVITTGNPALTSNPGALGQPGTEVIVGGNPPHKFEFPMTPGFDLRAGWDRGDGSMGLEIGGFFLDRAKSTQEFISNTDGSPQTYLPYIAPDGTFHTLPFTTPGVTTGSAVAMGMTHLWGLEADGVVPFTISRGAVSYYGKFLVGARYLDLTDHVRVDNILRLVANPSAFAYGAEDFTTKNEFAGPEVGTTLGMEWGRWSLEYTTKLAAGVTEQIRRISGGPLLSQSNPSPMLVPGPLQAEPSNVGQETAPRATLVPEIAVKSKVELTSWCSLWISYSLLYWNKVLCPGDQMDPLLNISQVPFQPPVPGPPDPKPLFNHTDYFAQGMELGIDIRY